jgi:WhiB family redox-sensing transcriptional regulator
MANGIDDHGDDYLLPEYDAEHAWMLEGLCRDHDASFFFPSDGVGVEHARMVCANCSVKVDCLEYALRYRIEHGVWGGASERERRRILRSRRLASH